MADLVAALADDLHAVECVADHADVRHHRDRARQLIARGVTRLDVPITDTLKERWVGEGMAEVLAVMDDEIAITDRRKGHVTDLKFNVRQRLRERGHEVTP